MLLLLLGASIWSVVDLKINIATFVDGFSYAVDFLGRVVPLDFPPIGEIASMVGQTLAIVVCATVLAILLSIPAALLAAHNTTVNAVVRSCSRVYIVVVRAIPELIMAMFFLRIFGLGAIPGILALGIGSIGMVAKLYADAIEELDPGPREALRAAGATKTQQIVGAILPALLPALVATALHRFDINLRGSVILGFVGVGGIGLEISGALSTLNYQRGLALAMILLALCLCNELISGLIRSVLLGHSLEREGKGSLLQKLRGRVERTSRGWVDQPAGPPAPVTSGAVRRVSPPWDAGRIRKTISGALALMIIVASINGAQISFDQVAGGLQQAWHVLSLYVPPGTAGMGDKLVVSMIETVQMALAATLIGLVTAIPVGVLAARNVAPNPRIARFCRILIVWVRAFPDLIIAICFVVITGLGAVAGTLALSLGALGFLSKIIADSIEETDVRVQEAVRASGADGPQVFLAATLRQAAPSVVSHVMHQLDNNIRGATGLGVVGAGGIGYYMMNANRVLHYEVVTSCLLLILVVVLAVEALAVWVRREVQ